MTSFSEIVEKLKDALSLEVGSRLVLDKDVADALNITPQKLSKLKKQNSIPYKELSLFAAHRRLSINWLLFGQDTKMLEEQTERYARIKYLSKISASCGSGAINYDDSAMFIEVGKVNLYLAGIHNTKHIEVIGARGDSMAPYIEDGQIVFVDRSKEFKQGLICAISTSEGCLVKRVFIGDGFIKLVSDNKAYKDIFLFDEEIRIEGVVVASGSLKDCQ